MPSSPPLLNPGLATWRMVQTATELTNQHYSASLLQLFHSASHTKSPHTANFDSSIKHTVNFSSSKPSCSATLTDALFIRTCFWYCLVSPCTTTHIVVRSCPATNFWFSRKSQSLPQGWNPPCSHNHMHKVCFPVLLNINWTCFNIRLQHLKLH